MAATGPQTSPALWPGRVENAHGAGRIVLVCEHAANAFPEPWGDLGLTAAQRQAHIAWDPGALGLARGLSAALDSVLVHAPVSRLIHDCNRAPDMAGAMPARSEIHDIPGNAAISPAERALRAAAVYAPFHATLQAVIARHQALGLRPALVTVHSFTPVWHGEPRSLELGVIHDSDDRLARAVLAVAGNRTRLRAALDEPYCAADDVTHTLRLHALPCALPHAMLEIRNDLIATPEAEAAMAATLAPVLLEALASLEAG